MADRYGNIGTTGQENLNVLTIDSLNTEGPTGNNEVTYIPNWTKWHGYYRNIALIASIIDAKARWTVGDGYESSEKEKLSKIKGFGKDDFNSLIFNQLRSALICGDSFGEIIKDKAGRLINIKPLNPASIRIVANNKGLISRYEQVAQVYNKNVINKFDKKEILHLSYNRIADEIHGISDIEKVETLVLALNQNFIDLNTVFHRYVKPLRIHKVDTDDEAEISKYKLKINTAFEKTENLIVPADTVKEITDMSIPQYSTLDPLPNIREIKRDIMTCLNVPDVILGWGSETTEASSKILYLSFEQTIKFYQQWLEDQILEQLGMEIKFNFPASIDPSLQSDNSKDRSINKMGVNPNNNSK